MGNEASKNIVKHYEIGSKIYEQRKLNLFQMSTIISQIGTDTFQKLGNSDLVVTLADRLPILFAIVLTESGTGQKEKNLNELTLDLSMNIDLETALEIMADLVELNNFTAMMEKATGIMAAVKGQMRN